MEIRLRVTSDEELKVVLIIRIELSLPFHDLQLMGTENSSSLLEAKAYQRGALCI